MRVRFNIFEKYRRELESFIVFNQFEKSMGRNESTVEHLGKVWEGIRVRSYYFIR